MKFAFSKTVLSTGLLFAAMAVSLVGCGGGDADTTAKSGEKSEADHDHAHAHEGDAAEPANFAEALAKLDDMKVNICKAFADGTPEDAHDALHSVGHTLEDLPALASAGGEMSAEQMTAVEEAVEKLFDGFGKLDGTLHGGEEVDIEELDKELTQAIDGLKELLK